MNEQATTTAPPGEVYWRHSVPCRTDSKMLLLNLGGVAVIGQWYGEVGEHFLAWCPLPKKAKPLIHDIEAAVDAWLQMERKAAMFDAIMRNDWLRPAAYHTGVWGWKEKYLERVDAEVAQVHPAQGPSSS